VITIRQERFADAAAREALLDVSYGPARFSKPSERLRKGRLPADGLSFVAVERGRVVGTVRLWHVAAGGGRAALLLGPLAVHPEWRNQGIGAALVERAIRAAAARGHGAVLLVGDAPFYGRFGFSAEKTGALRLAGSYERHRLLALELVPGALDGAKGLVAATGQPQREPRIPAVAASFAPGLRRTAAQAA
jgi:predicted N-acetyltransferase YhbS